MARTTRATGLPAKLQKVPMYASRTFDMLALLFEEPMWATAASQLHTLIAISTMDTTAALRMWAFVNQIAMMTDAATHARCNSFAMRAAITRAAKLLDVPMRTAITLQIHALMRHQTMLAHITMAAIFLNASSVKNP